MRESTLNYGGELKEIPISIPIDKRFNTTISPTPVQEQDLIELEGGGWNSQWIKEFMLVNQVQIIL